MRSVLHVYPGVYDVMDLVSVYMELIDINGRPVCSVYCSFMYTYTHLHMHIHIYTHSVRSTIVMWRIHQQEMTAYR